MRNIFKILRDDIRRCSHSAIGVIVLVGLVIVPVLYAWFNIAGSWDPYGNTGDLKVAVANSDAGYESDLIPIKVNLGDTVTSSLRENDQLGWEFVSEKDAVEGVEAGDYYAAVVIPEDFSANMMTLFSTEVKHSSIIYYENQKASAIAPRVTDKGASTIRQQIDETFAETIGNVGLATTSSLLDFMDSDQLSNFVAHLSSTLGTGVGALRDAADGTGSLAGVVDSSAGMLTSASALLEQAGGTNEQGAQLMADAQEGLKAMSKALDGAVDTANGALDGASSSYDSVSKAVDKAFDTANGHVELTARQLNDIAGKVSAKAADMRDTEQGILALQQKVADLPLLKPLQKEALMEQIRAVAGRVGAAAAQQEQLAARLNGAADALRKDSAAANKEYDEVKSLIEQAKAGVVQLRRDYEGTIKAQAGQLAGSVRDIVSASKGISGDLASTVKDLSAASGSLAGDLARVGGTLGDATGVLTSAADDLQGMKDGLDRAAHNGDLQEIRSLIGDDPEALANALSAPVDLDRRPVYHIKNYGSAMAPFYTTLSIWVGGIVLAAMLTTSIDEQRFRELGQVKQYQRYLGRFLFFALLSFLQSSLVCAGDLLFFQIQCLHPLQFLLAGWLAGFVFCNIIYTLTISFGDIGKAVAVVLLVMQVAGSGGTFPIEMTADFFQAVYPFLPFTHAINAMHAAMAGAFGMEYWAELGTLALYLVPSLALGLVFRRPVIRANQWIIEKLESTKLM